MENTATLDKVRITVITENLVRIEYLGYGEFADQPTLFAINREHNGCKFSFSKTDKELTVSTEYITLKYTNDGAESFTKYNLNGVLSGKKWRFGDKPKRNLGGTLSTLDEVKGFVKVEDGLLSKDGWFIYDDVENVLIEDGWIKKAYPRYGHDLYIFAYGNDYQKALNTLFYVSGKVPIPRKYVFGSWYSRWHPYSDKDIKDIIQGYKDNDFPLDIMVLDMDWHHNSWNTVDNEESNKHQPTYGYGHALTNLGWTGYSWNKNLIKNPKSLIEDLHKDNIYVTLNDHPHDGIRTHEDCYSSFMKEMQLPADKDINLEFDIGDKRYASAFFNNAHKPLFDDGVDFMWLDWQQDHLKPLVKGTHIKHLPWLNYVYFNMLKNNKRPISFSRWGGLGDHKHPIYFSGDTTSTWECLAFEIQFTAMSSNVGLMYWGHDTGGFCGKRNPEMYVRWTQFAGLSACLRVHSASETPEENVDRRPWFWGEKEKIAMRKVYKLRSQIFPYIYSLANEVYENGLPMIASTYIYYPSDKKAYRYPQQYFFGKGMIVAPITKPINKKGFSCQKIYIPEGVYYDIFTGKRYTKGTHVIKCPLDRYPVLVKGGIPIPMQPYTQRMASTPLDTLIIRCYEGENGSFTMYEDDGITENYLNGECLKTLIEYENNRDKIILRLTPSGFYKGMSEKRKLKIELPSSIKLISKDGLSVKYKDGINLINIDEVSSTQKIQIILYK